MVSIQEKKSGSFLMNPKTKLKSTNPLIFLFLFLSFFLLFLNLDFLMELFMKKILNSEFPLALKVKESHVWRTGSATSASARKGKQLWRATFLT